VNTSARNLTRDPLLCQWAGDTLPDKVVWGLDIGGANLKAALLEGTSGRLSSRSRPFALWRSPTRLADHLQQLTHAWPEPDAIAVTMTGEIADCYPSKATGVAAIVDQCELAYAARLGTLRYYAPNPDPAQLHFLSAAEAQHKWVRVAASNWHAVARLWGQWLTTQRHAPGLILDLGSTTLDLTPIACTQAPAARTDWERICRGELLYTGSRRSPLAAVLPTVTIDTDTWPLAQELFATIGDVYLITGDRTEDPDDCETADGRPATVGHAKQRLARMFCSDAAELPSGWLERVAAAAKNAHLDLISHAIERSLQQHLDTRWCLLLGEGEALLRQAWQRVPTIMAGSLTAGSRDSVTILAATDMLDSSLSMALPAAAVAVLALNFLRSGSPLPTQRQADNEYDPFTGR